MMRKRPFLLMCFAVLWVVAGAGATALAAQSPQIPLPGASIPKFVNQLPLLSIATGAAPYNTMQTVFGNVPRTVNMEEFYANVLPLGTPIVDNPATTTYSPTAGEIAGTTVPQTRVFGYWESTMGGVPAVRDTYIGPVIVNERQHFDIGTCDLSAVPSPVCTNDTSFICASDADCVFSSADSTDVTYVNNLGSVATTDVIWYQYAVDQTLHWGDPLGVNLGTPEENYCYHQSQLPDTPMQPWPSPGDPCAQTYSGPIPAVPHLHGGEIPGELDGGPDAWWTSDGFHYGHAYYTFGSPATNAAIYRYPNTQEAAPIWFHDHLLGGTRLNVYAGLAGAYLIYDPDLTLPTGLHFAGLMNGAPASPPPAPQDPTAEFTVPLVIQDRMFDTEGQFFYQSDSAGGVLWATNPEHPYWTPEFLGDVIVVNGKAWPNLNVEPKRYRFWLINGSNARTYELRIPNPVTGMNLPLYVIATDGGYLNSAAMTQKLVIMPGERYEMIVDFQGIPAGTMLVMKNGAKSPFPAGTPPMGSTTGQVMQFTVGACTSGFCGAADTGYNPAVTPAIRPAANAIVPLPTAGYAANRTRLLTLNEVLSQPIAVQDPVFTGDPALAPILAYPGGPLEILVNNTKYDGMNQGITRTDFTRVPTLIPGGGTDETFYSEIPIEGTTEMWEIVNLTADAHPIHLHLVQFQIINRQNYNINKYVKAYNASFPGSSTGPPPSPIDPRTGMGYAPGVFMPGYGPPLNYATGNPRALGGNPDITGYLQGMVMPPLPQEAGWKDTVVAYPGQVTRLAVRWAPTDVPVAGPVADLAFAFDPTSGLTYPHGWVWHCHIVDHEDNEMMRPFAVSANASAGPRTVVIGTDF